MKKAPVSSRNLFVAGVLALAAAYIFVSLAIDRGSFVYYTLTFFSLILGFRQLHRAWSAKRPTTK